LKQFIFGTILLISLAVVIYSNSSVFAQLQQKEYSFAFKWGSNGTGDGQFIRPHGVDFDSQGNVYITERTNNVVQKFTHDGKFLKKWGQGGSDPGDLEEPYEVKVYKDYVYVVDKDNNRIQKFDTNGKFIKLWDRFNAPDGGFVKMNLPEAIAFNPSTGNVYITDTGNNRTLKLDSNFNFVLQWGYYGRGQGQFDHPHGIGVDSKGNVYVNELYVARIQKFDSNGNFIKQWGSNGTGNGQFAGALEHLFVGHDDSVWQVDAADNPRVQKFDTEGNYITSVGSGPCIIPDDVKSDPQKMANYKECDGKLAEPEHANLDSEGNLYVVDRGNQRIEVFSPVR